MASASGVRACIFIDVGLAGTDTPLQKMWSYKILQQEKQNPHLGG
jgi:hypothetical protein